MKNSVDITVILDRSGSMATIQTDMEGALQNFVKETKKNSVETNFSLVQFDNLYEEVLSSRNINLVNESEIKLVPRGVTALLDAVGRTINGVGERLDKLPENEKPNKVVLVVVTDGHENCSREFNKEQVKQLTEQQQNKYNWQFVYLGANQDSFSEAGRLGILGTSTMNYAPTTDSINVAFSSLTNNLRSYSAGRSANVAFDDSDYKNQENLGVPQNK